MRINVTTSVAAAPRDVFSHFDRDLFVALNPPFPPVRVERFDGCSKGDEVHLVLNFLLFRQRWISVITESGETENEIYFVDEGRELPFFFKTWRHQHRIQSREGGSVIIDDIEYTCPLPLMAAAMYPVLYLQFLYRKPVYRRWFSS